MNILCFWGSEKLLQTSMNKGANVSFGNFIFLVHQLFNLHIVANLIIMSLVSVYSH